MPSILYHLLKLHLVALLLIITFPTQSQPEWNLKVDKEGIKVYNRTIEGEKFDEIRVVTSFPGRLSDIVAILLDVEHQHEWSYATKRAHVLKKISGSELYFYKEIACPMPLSNRDLVGHLTFIQDPETKVLAIQIDEVKDFIPVTEGIVRVPFSKEKWLVTPGKDNTVTIDFYLKADPGGTVSSFLVNMFSTKGPFETFNNLRDEVEKRKDKVVKFSFVKD